LAFPGDGLADSHGPCFFALHQAKNKKTFRQHGNAGLARVAVPALLPI
jgi:hypothetical protein